MRKICTLFTVAALALAGGCKKNDTDRAADRMDKARDDMKEQAKDVRKDMNKETAARRDMTQQQRELDKAHGDLAVARAEYDRDVHARLMRIDAKIDELSRRTDAKSHEIAERARITRAEVAAKLDTARDATSER